MATFLENYKRDHTHPVNRALHTIGIPTIVISILMAIVIGIWYEWQYWEVALGLFIGGWILQFIGHFFEGKAPSFFRNPIYLLVGPIWWLLKVLGIKKPSNNDQNK